MQKNITWHKLLVVMHDSYLSSTHLLPVDNQLFLRISDLVVRNHLCNGRHHNCLSDNNLDSNTGNYCLGWYYHSSLYRRMCSRYGSIHKWVYKDTQTCTDRAHSNVDNYYNFVHLAAHIDQKKWLNPQHPYLIPKENFPYQGTYLRLYCRAGL